MPLRGQRAEAGRGGGWCRLLKPFFMRAGRRANIIRKGIALQTATAHRTGQLMVISLNNYLAVEAAYGAEAACSAMEHLRRTAERHFGRATLRSVHRHEMQLLVSHAPLRCLPGGSAAETLCSVLMEQPYRWGDEEILLSVSAASAAVSAMEDPLDDSLAEARGRLALSCLQGEQIFSRSNEAVAQYRKDMAAAAGLMRLVRRGAAFFTWRPVAQPDDPGLILYYEAMLRRVGHMGEQIDCADGYAALDRLGMAYLLDRRMLSDVIDELEGDPAACLNVAISSQSLSLNLLGEETGWNDMIERLKRDPGLARRLVIEIADNGGMPHFRDAVAFVRGLRELGVRIAIGRFGSGHASIGQLMALSPDAIKIDSAFMHTAYQSGRNRARVSHLIGLARTMSPIVILDGVESPWHLHIAREEEAQWVAGSHLGRPSLRRGWLNAGYSATVASLTAFNSAFQAADSQGQRLPN